MFDSNVKAVPNVDVIRNFDRADRDTLVLDTDIFRQAGAVGTLSGDVLANWGKSVGAEDRILYRHLDTGDAGTDPDLINLYYDRNGGSTSDAVLFAKLTNQAAPVTAADFFLFA